MKQETIFIKIKNTKTGVVKELELKHEDIIEKIEREDVRFKKFKQAKTRLDYMFVSQKEENSESYAYYKDESVTWQGNEFIIETESSEPVRIHICGSAKPILSVGTSYKL